MEVQNQVIRSLRSDLARLRGVSGASRNQLADRVCAAFGFRDARGRLQRMTCMKALAVLEAEGHISLPPSRSVRRRQKHVVDPVAPACDVPDAVGAVEGLKLVLVTDARQRAIWNGAHEHPRGAGPFVGCQLRYLVGSAHGWLGAVGFAASARHLVCRDHWIGWNDDRRRACLHRVLCLSRFLIRPGVECRNLASHVLRRVAGVVGDDFGARYGYRPCLLETFIEDGQHTGVSFRAANWRRVGKTSGRGRLGGAAETQKAVYMYELDAGWREHLRVPEPRLAPLEAGAGLDRKSWAEQEFGGAPLGDARLSTRLVTCARIQADTPMRAFTGAARGDRALIKAYYRLIDKPDNEAVTVENILQPHRHRTLQRMQGEKTVLCVQDGSTLNFAKRGKTEGLGIIGKNQTAAAARGLHLHATIAVNTEGLPLGVLRAAFDAPQPGAEKNKPREEKKSYRWIEGLRDSAAAAAALDSVQVVGVMDREADFVDLFVERRERAPGVELLVRAKTNRVLGEDDKLFDKVRKSPAQGKLVIEVKRLSARIKASKQAAKAVREPRQATVRLRYLKVELPAKRKAPVELTIVHVREENPPTDDERLEWFLLTTLPVESAADAERILTWYGLRWRIEDYFRVLKSGCKVEELENRTAERLQRAAAMVIAWRIHLMARLGRELPDLPPEILFADIELRVLALFAKSRRKGTPKNLGEAVSLVAALGGHFKRKRDPPGSQLMWFGYAQLAAMAFFRELEDEYQ